jgi:tRNA (guanine37-N1)-methyltransferase
VSAPGAPDHEPAPHDPSATGAPLRFDVLTIFPGMFSGPLDESILKRARDAALIDVRVHDLRQWATDRHRTVDDYPFGGGPGMVMKPEPLFAALDAIQAEAEPRATVVLLTPQGRPLDRALVDELAARPRLLLICGRYEGVDERVREHAVDLEVSAADVVLSGGELPALLLIDAVSRRIPGVLGGEGSLDEESFEDGLLEYPQYTRPAEFRDWRVPDVLLSGNHGEVEKWRRRLRVERTAARRPDLLDRAVLAPEERRALTGDPGFAQLRRGDTLFQVRVAAVATSRGRVLLHRTAGAAVWSLPGGRLRVGEPAAEAIARELREEARMKVEPGEVLWVHEQFFDAPSAWDGPGRGEPLTHHEIGVYIAVRVPPRFEDRDTFGGVELAGTEHEFRLEFRWCAPADLDALDVRPAPVRDALKSHLERLDANPGAPLD